MKEKGKNIKIYLLLIFAMFLYSFTGIFSKLASRYAFMSYKYIFCYLGIILVLGLYAIIWQQILKNIDLSIAMSFRPLVLVFSILWATILFGEYISPRMIVGFALIFIGITVSSLKYE